MVVLTTFSQPTEGIRHKQPNTTAYVNDNNIGKGTLYIAESCLSWISDSGDGFSIEYPNISLQAVSRDLVAFSHECLFLILDIALGDEESKNGDGENDDENDGSDDEQIGTELRFVPDDRGMLGAMFHAMNACQALHPDPEDSVSDEDLYGESDEDIHMDEIDSRMVNLNMGLEVEAWERASSEGNNCMEFELRGIWEQGEQVEQVEEGMVEDKEEGMEEDRLVVEDREEGKVVDKEEGKGVDRLVVVEEGRVEGRLVVEGEGRVEGRLVVEEGRVEGREGGKEEGQVYRVQGDRPFHLESTEHQGSLAPLLQVRSSHTASYFSDAES